MPSHPKQGAHYYSEFQADTMFYYNYQEWLFNTIYNFGKKKFQGGFIQHLYHCTKVLQIANDGHQSLNTDDANKYKAGCFFSTIQAIVTDLDHYCFSGTPAFTTPS